jgi:hypothetical protein
MLRLQSSQVRHDRRAWQVKRRERTKQLIELGGLVAKAGLIALAEDDRTLLYGALLDVAGLLRGEERDRVMALWRRRGKRAFEDESRREE